MAEGTEPSIEDILASIRKIISDDDVEGDAPTASDGAAEPDQVVEPNLEEDEVLELTDVVQPSPGEESKYVPHNEAGPAHDDTRQEVYHEEHEPTIMPQAMPMNNDHNDQNDHNHRAEEGIITDRTLQAATGAFAKLTHEADPPEYRTSGDGKTVEDIARELLRPMLRQWMDQNLPQIVERLVERELRKISRKAEDL